MANLRKYYLEKNIPECKVSYTVDKTIAYQNVDFVFCQIRTGGFKMRELDEKIPLKHNVLGQETCGPGGFGMRSIKDMIEIVNDVRSYAKDAWILNYTAAIVAVALKKEFPNDHRILNICDQPINLLKSYGKLVDKKYSDFEPVYFGLNHFGWFKHLYDEKGIDYMPKIKSMILKDGFEPADKEERDKSWLATYAMVKDILDNYPDYLPNTYLQYYLYPEYKVSLLDKNYTRTNEVIEFLVKERYMSHKQQKNSPVAVNEAHADMIVDLAIAIAFNKNQMFIMMVENNGCISNISDDAIVEVNTIVGKNGPRPFNVGSVDTFYKGMIEQQYAYEKLVVEAYFEKII